MSEISAISNQYETVVNTTDKFNNSIVSLKKRSISRTGNKEESKKLKFSEEEFKDAKEYILHFLRYILSIQSNEKVNSDMIPLSLINDFSSRIKISFPFIETEIQKIIDSLVKENDLTMDQFLLLDKLAAALDGERTILFRKLKTARG